MNPLISVVMPTYGRPEFLVRAINSVLNQDYQNYELIIVDDNNPETEARKETEKVLGKILESHSSHIVYFKRDSNGGGAKARNDGIMLAKGKYVTFLDDDDQYLPNKLTSQVRHIQNGDLDISICGMQAVRNHKNIYYSASFPRGETLKDFILDGSVFTPMIMVKRALIKDVGGFTITPRFQDHLLMMKLLKENPKVSILNEKLYIFNMHDGERVTFSKKSIYALDLKHEHEMKHLNLLNDHELGRLIYRQNKERILILSKSENNNFGDILNLIINSNNKKDFFNLIGVFLFGILSNFKFLIKIKDLVKSKVGGND